MLTWWACSAAPAAASQAPAADPSSPDPINCWWRTDRSAVHVGEQFTLALTCGVIDTADVRVTTDPGRLDPAALDLAPFEVLGGTQHNDIEAPPWRYFQYSYTLRLVGDEFFGRDVDIPSIPITYNIESSGATATRGRDQLYLLPAVPVRVLSLVPLTATDIQDWSPETFGDIDRRTLRATGELAAAGVFFAFAAVLAGLAVVRIARPRLARIAAEPRLLAPPAVLRGCIHEIGRVKAEADRSGWTADLIGRALTVLRIAGAIALGRPVAQRIVNRSEAAQEGQLTFRKGPLSADRVLISAATTTTAVAARLAADSGGTMNPRLQTTLEELRESLRVFAAARYSRGGDLDAPALDGALDTAVRALQRLHAMNQWRARTADSLSRATVRIRETVWSR